MDNYIHDQFMAISDPHYDGITVLGGQNHVVIEHNTIYAPSDHGTAEILIQNVFGPVNDVQINNNLLLGTPSYTVYFEDKTGTPNITNINFTNNYVQRGAAGYYDIVNSNPTMSGNVQWNNNTDPTPYPKLGADLPSSPSSPTSTPSAADDRVVLERHREGGRWHHQRQYPSAQGYRCRQQHRQDLRRLDPDRHNDRQFDRELGLHHLGPEQCEACADRDRDHLERPDQCRVRCGVRNGGYGGADCPGPEQQLHCQYQSGQAVRDSRGQQYGHGL